MANIWKSIFGKKNTVTLKKNKLMQKKAFKKIHTAFDKIQHPFKAYILNIHRTHRESGGGGE